MTSRFNVLAELHRIRDENDGVLTPEAVVEDSTPEDAPLHNHFEWDDKKAAHKHRIEQARQIIRSFRVEMPEPAARLYHAVKIGNVRQYMTIDEVKISSELSKQVGDRLEKTLAAVVRDIAYLKALAPTRYNEVIDRFRDHFITDDVGDRSLEFEVTAGDPAHIS